MAQGVSKKNNSISKEDIYRLTVTFCIDQKMKTAGVCRLVWNAFVSKLDFKNDQLCILHKDGDGRNNHYKNLTVGNQSKMARQAYKRGRLIKLKEYLNESVFVKSGLSRCKTITQYDLNGCRFKIYNSIKEAAAQTGICHSNISMAAKGKKLQMGGFI